MNNTTFQVTYLTSNKSGILSTIAVKSSKFGLVFNNNQSAKIDDNKTRIVLTFSGSLKVSEQEYIEVMESHSEIYSVEDIVLIDGSNDKSASSSSADSDKKLITIEGLKKAEQRLANFLGPIAPVIVKSVASKATDLDALYLLLSEELEEEDRQDFLASKE